MLYSYEPDHPYQRARREAARYRAAKARDRARREAARLLAALRRAAKDRDRSADQ